MKRHMTAVFVFLIGYCVGGLNPAYLLAKRRGFDIRAAGTHNAGASNAAITIGKKAGVAVALLDIFKAFAVVKLCALLFPHLSLSREISGVACMLGHMFPAAMQFHGGKGLACLGGVILAYSPVVFLVFLLGTAFLALVTGYLTVVPVTAAVAFPLYYLYRGGSPAGFGLYMIVAGIMEGKHIENFRRIRAGTEVRTGFLWNKDRELARVEEAKAAAENDSECEEHR